LPRAAADDAGQARVRFYDFAQRLSLIEGPLRIAATDYQTAT